MHSAPRLFAIMISQHAPSEILFVRALTTNQGASTMSPVIAAMSLALALSVYWIYDNAECLLEPGTDSCVECGEECLELEVTK